MKHASNDVRKKQRSEASAQGHGSIARGVLVALFACLTSFALALRVREDAFLAFDSFSVVVYLGFGLGIFVYGIGVYRKKIRPRAVSIVLAVVLALMTIVGLLLDGCGTLCAKGIVIPSVVDDPVVFESRFILAGVLALAFLGYALLYCFLAELAFEALVTCNWAPSPGKDASRGKLARLCRYPICFAILVVAWVPAIAAVFPGSFTSDEARQLAGFFGTGGVELSNHFPYFCGLVYGGIYSLGTSIDPSGMLGTVLILALQVIVSALVMSAVVIWLDRLGAPRFLPIAALAFFALFPLVGVRQVMLGYDTLHAAFFLLFVLQIVLFARSRTNEVPASWLYHPVAMAVVGVLMLLTRNNGVFVVVPALVVLAIMYRSKVVAVCSAAVLVVYAAWSFAALPMLGVAKGEIGEALTMPVQVVASQLASSATVTGQERAVLEEAFDVPLDEVANNYNPLISDPVKTSLVLDDAGEAAAFVGTAFSMGLRAPLQSLSAALCTTYGSWYPYRMGTYWPEFAPFILKSDDPYGMISSWYAASDDLDAKQGRAESVVRNYTLLSNIPPLSVLYAPGLYAWVMLVVGAFALWAKSQRRLTLCMLVPGIVLQAVLLAAPVSSIRYAFPIMICLPLFVYALTLIARTAAQERDR